MISSNLLRLCRSGHRGSPSALGSCSLGGLFCIAGKLTSSQPCGFSIGSYTPSCSSKRPAKSSICQRVKTNSCWLSLCKRVEATVSYQSATFWRITGDQAEEASLYKSSIISISTGSPVREPPTPIVLKLPW